MNTFSNMRDYDTPIARIESLTEMATAMGQELARARARHGFKEAGRAFFERHLAHYVLAHYFEQPEEVRDAILAEGRRIMEERRRSPTPVYWKIVRPEADGNAPAISSGYSPTNPPFDPGPAKRGKKSG